MLVSTSILSKAIENYRTTEKFEESKKEDAKKGASGAAYTALLIFAIILFIFEIVVLVHAIKIALKCSKPGAQRISHLVLATFFTYPYLLIALFLSPCGGDVL